MSRASATRCRGSDRSRSAARPSAPGSTRTPSSPSACAARLAAETGLADLGAGRPVRGAGRARRARRGLRRAEDRGGLADEDRQRPPLHGLRPASRPRRDRTARASEGQLDHAGQGQPRDPRGRHAGGGAGDRQRPGDRDRRHAGPFRAQRLHPDDGPQPARLDRGCWPRASRLLAEKCVDGIEANRETCEHYAELTLSAATALNPYIGYDTCERDRQGGGTSRADRCARSRARRASTTPRWTRRWTTARWRSHTSSRRSLPRPADRMDGSGGTPLRRARPPAHIGPLTDVAECPNIVVRTSGQHRGVSVRATYWGEENRRVSRQATGFASADVHICCGAGCGAAPELRRQRRRLGSTEPTVSELQGDHSASRIRRSRDRSPTAGTSPRAIRRSSVAPTPRA